MYDRKRARTWTSKINQQTGKPGRVHPATGKIDRGFGFSNIGNPARKMRGPDFNPDIDDREQARKRYEKYGPYEKPPLRPGEKDYTKSYEERKKKNQPFSEQNINAMLREI
tara:strand:+ start:1089 stop:1421 length:333 start_codon:yes stop_codon:yes gene_type:complete